MVDGLPAPAAPAAPAAVEPGSGRTLGRPSRPAQGLQTWWRAVVLAIVAAALSVLTWWQQSHSSDQPARLNVILATPGPVPDPWSPARSGVAQPAPAPAVDPALLDTMRRLGAGLAQRDVPALLSLADPDGLQAAPFTGGLPEGGYDVGDAGGLVQALLGGGNVRVRGWRSAGSDGIVILTDGWWRVTLPLANNVTLEMTPVAALGLVPRDGRWYWRWVLPDPVGALAEQLRSMAWQPWPE